MTHLDHTVARNPGYESNWLLLFAGPLGWAYMNPSLTISAWRFLALGDNFYLTRLGGTSRACAPANCCAWILINPRATVGPRRLTQGPRIYTPNFTNACRFYRRIAYDRGYAGRPLALLPYNVAALTCAQ